MLGSLSQKSIAAGACFAVALATARWYSVVRAGSIDSMQPTAPASSTPPSSTPASSSSASPGQSMSDDEGLYQLDRASQKLFAEVRPSVVEVDFPTPLWVRQLAMQYPLDK